MLDKCEEGVFWFPDPDSEREFCYKVLLKKPSHSAFVYDCIYEILGELGYRFVDAGRNGTYVIVSLNKPISARDLSRLSSDFIIANDTGNELVL